MERVISGDYKSIKENRIKIIRLKSKYGKTINEVFVNSAINELFISNNQNSVHYKLNDFGNPIQITSGENSFTINYFSEDFAKSITRTSIKEYSTQSTFYPDFQNLNTIYNTSTHFSDKDLISIKSVNYIDNRKNPELSYTETIYNKAVFRKYKNGNETTRINHENFQSIDSTYIVKGKHLRNYHFTSHDKDSIIVVKDTVLTQILKHGKLSYENSYLHSNIISEKFFNEGNLAKKKEYMYQPYYENKKDTAAKGTVLWEIKTHLQNGITKSEFPLKRHYKLKNHKLIENKKNKLVYISNPSDYIFSENKTRSFSSYYAFSPSILSYQQFLQYLYDVIAIYGENEINYCQYSFQKDKCIYKIGEDFDVVKNQLSRFLSRRIHSQSYQLEIITEDNKMYHSNLNDYINTIDPIIDLVSVKE